MNTIFVKENGVYIQKDLNPITLIDFFKDHSTQVVNEQGEKTSLREIDEDVVVYGGIEVKLDGEGFDWVLSDMTLDRDMERMDPTGWDLKEYRKNPLVMWSHERWIPAIGVIKNLKKPKEESGQLTGTVVFDESGTDPLALMIASKVRAGILTKGSVGFRVKMIEILEDQRDGTRLIHRKQELVEFSIVNLPSNPSAQVQRMAKDLASEYEMSVEEASAVLQNAARMPKTYISELLQDDKRHEANTGETSNFGGHEASASETSDSEGCGDNASDLEKLFRDKSPNEGKSILEGIFNAN